MAVIVRRRGHALDRGQRSEIELAVSRGGFERHKDSFVKANAMPEVSVFIDMQNHERFIECEFPGPPGHIGVIRPDAVGRPEGLPPHGRWALSSEETGVADG
jgi:hypothetical protein